MEEMPADWGMRSDEIRRQHLIGIMSIRSHKGNTPNHSVPKNEREIIHVGMDYHNNQIHNLIN